MSTRCQIEFYPKNSTEPYARIYQHFDGYPEEVIPRLRRVEQNLSDVPQFGNRLDDTGWGAAEFISQFRKPLGGDIYVTQYLQDDIEYLYRVVCTPKGYAIRILNGRFQDITRRFDLTTGEPKKKTMENR